MAAGPVGMQCGSCRSGLGQSRSATVIQWALLLLFVSSAYILPTWLVVIVGTLAIAAMLVVASRHPLQVVYIAPGAQQGAAAEPPEKPGGRLS